MATMLTEVYGPKSGTNASKFQAYAAIRYTESDPVKGYYIQTRRYLLYSPGNGYSGGEGFQGALFWRNWGKDFNVYGNDNDDYSSKIYGDTGWVNVGWVEPGKTYSVKAECGYTSNSMGELKSSVTATATVEVMLTPPAAPTLVEPASGYVVSDSDDSVTFVWKHNPTDETVQTAAELQHSVDGGTTWTTVQVEGNAQSLDAEMFPVNSTVVWRVRTKGSYNEYGPWSETRVFYVYNPPSASFIEPSEDAVVTGMPMHVAFAYNDASGVLAASTLSIYLDGESVYTRNIGAVTEALIEPNDWLPENGRTYTLRVDVRSSTTLSAYATSEVSFEFTPPMKGMAKVTQDPETGFAHLRISTIAEEGLEVPTRFNVMRITANGSALVCADLQDGAEAVDKYAPLNIPYSYDIVSFSEEGAHSTNRVEAPAIKTKWWFFYFGDGDVARVRWNPAGNISPSRPEDEEVHYWGRPDPVSYTGTAIEEQRQLSATLETREQALAFDRLLKSGGRAVYKSADGDVMRVKATPITKPAYTVASYYGTVTVKMKRIDGEVL